MQCLYLDAAYTVTETRSAAGQQEVAAVLWHRCRCGNLIPQNMSICEQCAAGSQNNMVSRHMEYNMYRRNKKTAAFYISAEWRGLRATILQLYDQLDIYAYYVQKRIVTADMVHHIDEVEECWGRRLDPTNLLPLSNTNHGIISALYRRDETSKRDTQALLWALIEHHWEGAGGIQNVLAGLS